MESKLQLTLNRTHNSNSIDTFELNSTFYCANNTIQNTQFSGSFNLFILFRSFLSLSLSFARALPHFV